MTKEDKVMEIYLLQNVPIGWIFGSDDTGHIVSVQINTFDEENKSYVPVGMIERNENVTLADVQTLIDFYNENGDVPVPLVEPRSVVGVEYTALANSAGWTDKYLVWKFISQDVIKNTTWVNQWVRIVAHNYYACDVTANLGFYWLQNNTWFHYGNRAIRVARNNSSYPSYPNEQNLDVYRSDITHNADGTFYRTSAVQCTSSGNTTGFPTFTTWDIGVTFPTIDRTAPTVTVAFVSKTHNSLSFNVKTNVNCDEVQFRINGGSWTILSGGTSANVNKKVTLSGLSPDTLYEIEFSAKKTSNQVWGYSAKQTQATNKPSIPSAGSVSVRDITPFTAIGIISGFTIGDMASLDQYRYKVLDSMNNEVIPLTSNGKSTTIHLDGLQPETTYALYVEAVDSYGQSSDWASDIFTTLVDQAKIWIKRNGIWKQGKLFYKKNGRWVQAKKVFKKNGGKWS